MTEIPATPEMRRANLTEQLAKQAGHLANLNVRIKRSEGLDGQLNLEKANLMCYLDTLLDKWNAVELTCIPTLTEEIAPIPASVELGTN